jgi:Fe2+ transport system protein FeoA
MNTSQLHQCPLCGYEFDTASMMCHTSCPLSRGCSIICCPNCGYQMPDENRLRGAGALKRLWERYTALRQVRYQPGASQPLATLRVGQQAEVTAIAAIKESRLARLSAFGLVPGSFVRLQQRSPAYVIFVDETEIALDAEIAHEIMVQVK